MVNKDAIIKEQNKGRIKKGQLEGHETAQCFLSAG